MTITYARRMFDLSPTPPVEVMAALALAEGDFVPISIIMPEGRAITATLHTRIRSLSDIRSEERLFRHRGLFAFLRRCPKRREVDNAMTKMLTLPQRA